MNQQAINKKDSLLQNDKVLSWILLIILSFIWGSSFILVKRGLEVFSPIQTASIRISAAYISLLVISIYSIKKIPRNKWKYLFFSGLLGVFFPAFLFAFAQIGLSSSLAGVLNSLTPFFTLIVGLSFFNQNTSWLKIFGIFIGLIGAVALILMSSKTGRLEFNVFALFVIASAFFYGTNINLVKFYLSDLKPLYVSTITIFIVGPFGLASFFISNVHHTLMNHENSLRAFLYVVLLGITASAIATILFNRLLQISTPIFASSVTYLIPIVAVMWGVIDGERLHLGHLMCMIIIIFGVWIVNMKPKVRLKPELAK